MARSLISVMYRSMSCDSAPASPWAMRQGFWFGAVRRCGARQARRGHPPLASLAPARSGSTEVLWKEYEAFQQRNLSDIPVLYLSFDRAV